MQNSLEHLTASERLNARSAINTIQAQRSVVGTQAQRSVVDTQAQHSVAQEIPMTLPEHLGVMRPTMMDSIAMSHISEMHTRHST